MGHTIAASVFALFQRAFVKSLSPVVPRSRYSVRSGIVSVADLIASKATQKRGMSSVTIRAALGLALPRGAVRCPQPTRKSERTESGREIVLAMGRGE